MLPVNIWIPVIVIGVNERKIECQLRAPFFVGIHVSMRW